MPPIDISGFSVEETTRVLITDATGAPITGDDGAQISVTVYGPGSATFQSAQGRRNAALVESVRKGKRLQPDAQRQLDAAFLAACTASFNGFHYHGSATGYETFKAAYTDPKIGFLAEQVDSALSDWGNFSRPGPTN